MVQPAPQPFSVAATASVSGWSGSGVNPAASSSPTGVFPGPHYVEEQSLHISYFRVPTGRETSSDISLNDASANYAVNSTHIACIITANYSRKKVDAIFDTSSYQQPQKFQFLGMSADQDGRSYGAIDASTLGPVGEIVTVQPWYYRRPFVDTDTEVASSVVVANYAIGASGEGPALDSKDQRQVRDFKNFFIRPAQAFSHLEIFSDYAYSRNFDYFLPGAYNTSQESLAQIISFIDTTANRLTTERLFKIPANLNPFSGQDFARDTGLPFYEAFRHDYS
tara:strand:- start:9131 stop:9970 length:840 start_codon:yes stop_codon:yes gene_type:complete